EIEHPRPLPSSRPRIVRARLRAQCRRGGTGRVGRDRPDRPAPRVARKGDRMTTTMTAATATAVDLRDRYHAVRAFTEALARPLSAEDQTVQTMPDVSPTKW